VTTVAVQAVISFDAFVVPTDWCYNTAHAIARLDLADLRLLGRLAEGRSGETDEPDTVFMYR